MLLEQHFKVAPCGLVQDSADTLSFSFCQTAHYLNKAKGKLFPMSASWVISICLSIASALPQHSFPYVLKTKTSHHSSKISTKTAAPRTTKSPICFENQDSPPSSKPSTWTAASLASSRSKMEEIAINLSWHFVLWFLFLFGTPTLRLLEHLYLIPSSSDDALETIAKRFCQNPCARLLLSSA